MDLNDYRRQIDEIDTQLLALFAQRMEVAAGIAAYKKEHGLPVLDSGRERQKLLDIAAKSPDAVKEYAGIDFGAISDNAQAVAAAEAIGVELPEAAEDDLFSFLASPAPETPKPEPGMEQGELF